MTSKIPLVQKNIYFFIQGLIKVSIAVIQMSSGEDSRLLRVKVEDNKTECFFFFFKGDNN